MGEGEEGKDLLGEQKGKKGYSKRRKKEHREQKGQHSSSRASSMWR